MSLVKALLVASGLIAALLPAAVLAQGQGHGRGRGADAGKPVHMQPEAPGKKHKKPKGGHGSGDTFDFGLTISFSGQERDLIRDWLTQHSIQPAGLPPGIAKNLQRGKPLPPGIAKRYLPGGLLGHLPDRDGYEYLIIGASVALVAAATGIVVDIIRDAL